ncbi:hypothetical protein PPL_09225 [Heterostelium album PN500]|uniref:Thioredoxin domain-containing protein n=1 Tax=Heterostelium pallidum (strain ATCC 26659 / Pp 5 / PN500) TaxID=670386 RepID=D3BKZ3_HETP5|nr:hypothetical protein PPL_09225 [Heterostelium album PN500]EFA78573.1 hypothetical protein PPL_09225 [Heterostelium album PN500]|eukprot:XP_020430697.1 hypothetical protein PPL_09225 [Heterostelium album PN500]
MTTNRYCILLIVVALALLSTSQTVSAKVFDYEENNVIVTNGKSIDSLIKSTKDVVVYFYTKTKESEKFMNSFLKISSQFNDDGSSVRFVVIDLEKDFATRSKYEIQDPITIVYYKNGQALSDFILPKSAGSLKSFVENPLAPIPVIPGPGSWNKIDSQVYHLTKRNFTQFIQTHPKTLVMFYSPGCGHCERMKPAYAEASITVQKEHLGDFAAYDCNSEMSICEKYKIKGFPTAIYFHNAKESAQYTGDRTVDDMVEWFRNPSIPSPSQKKKQVDREL